jgi:hypothetical protein
MTPNTINVLGAPEDVSVDEMGNVSQHGAHSIPGCDNPDCEAASIWKPLRHQPYNADIDDAGANAAEEPVGQEQHPDIVDVSRQDPPEPC